MDTFQFGEWASLSETPRSGRSVSFFPSVSNPASLLPRRPPPFSRVYLFGETVAPWDIATRAGRQTEQVFFFLLSLSVSDFIPVWVKFLATHHHSTCRLHDEEASGCVCSSLSLLPFLAVCESLLIRSESSTCSADISDNSPKTQIDSHHNRKCSSWKHKHAVMSSGFFLLIFFFIHEASHLCVFVLHTFIWILFPCSSPPSLCTVTYMHTFHAYTLIHFRLPPCSLSCSSAEHSSTVIKAVYLQCCSPFPSNAA